MEERIKHPIYPHLGSRIGTTWFSLFKHNQPFQVLSTKHKSTNNKQPHRSTENKICFSQPVGGLQGYMLLLIHWTPHRPDAGRILLMSEVACMPRMRAYVCASFSPEPQLNLSDISSRVLFPYYKGPTVTQCQSREFGHMHTLISTHAVSLVCSSTHTHQGKRIREQKKAQNQIKPSARLGFHYNYHIQ